MGMDFCNNRILRVISTIVLALFIWTFCGIFEIAYAIDKQLSQSSLNQPKEQRQEEKFEKSIKDIEEITERLKKVQTHEEREAEKEGLRTKRQEIEGHDVEIRSQFAETEEKIKNLPDAIKQRHKDFVKKYEENLNILRRNLDDIEKAETKSEIDAVTEKLKAHLEKTRPPSRHIPLDPNKLPHRKAEPTKKKPRLKKEDFESDQRPQTSDNRLKKPILVASIGDLQGILTNAATQALAPPTAADLSETPEIQFTPEIRAKAVELGNNPVKIYQYVRNNFEYEPYYGSLKGAQQTLLEKAGNDFDQASLLIALLRASNIPARYVYGTIELPIEKLMNWVGGVTDPNTAAQILATAGVPGQLFTEGGQIKYAQMEHVWVEAYIPYGNYRGSMRDDSIKTWIPLDPSFKQYDHKRGLDLYTAMGINGEKYIMDYITDTSPSPIPPELQGLLPDFTISPYQYYSRRLLNYIDASFPDATTEDIIGGETISQSRAIIKKEYPFLPSTLSYKVTGKGATYSSIPDNLRHRISLSIENPQTNEIELSYSITLSEIAGKRITLSYIPATSTDEALVTQYGGLLNVPPYLLNVKPMIKIDGITAATGSPVGLGYNQTFNISFTMPNKGVDIVTNKITAGDYSGIAISYYKIPSDLVANKMETLTKNINSQDIDDLLGQMLYNIGLSYLHHLTFEEELYAKNLQMIITKEPSEAIATSQAITEWLFGIPYKITEGGVAIDVDRNIYAAFSIDGNQQRKKDFMIVSGIGSSSWEDMILQSFIDIPSVSAAKLLKIANQQGIPIYTIDSGNINTLLPQLQVSNEAINEIKNAVNAGKKAIVSQTNIQYNDWNGVGYIILDPASGAGAYMISGGLAGAEPSWPLPTSQRELDALYKRICAQTRGIILETAIKLIGTPYRFGCRDPKGCGGIDCSGLVEYAYGKAGIISVARKTAQEQYNVTLPTDYPLYADLVFFSGMYDKNEDCYINKSDGVTHTGIAFRNGWMIAAQSSVVDIYSIRAAGTGYEKKAKSYNCDDKKCSCNNQGVDVNSGKCPGSDDCYTWESTGTFYSFEGYRYAKEFDEPSFCK
jgi:transglutaminase-like putative cysteine protease/cell wall-associated NlpC family hydrolase